MLMQGKILGSFFDKASKLNVLDQCLFIDITTYLAYDNLTKVDIYQPSDINNLQKGK